MRIVLQRVKQARVEVDGQVTGAIGPGLVILLAIARTDSKKDVEYLLGKVLGLRVFPDTHDRMNRDIRDAGGGLLIVSQFTLYGDCRKGRRPGFDLAASPEQAAGLYQYFLDTARQSGIPVASGVFQAHMDLYLVNDGPVTLILDSPDAVHREPAINPSK